MSSDSDKEKQNVFPLFCGFVLGSMPALLWLPIIGRLMRWLLENGMVMLVFVFANYLPWMIGMLLGRMLGLPVFIPVLFCFCYWLFLGSMAGTPKYSKMACVYIFTAHLLIPLVFLLTFSRSSNILGFPLYELIQRLSF